jgi:hypothetical protein
MFTKKILNDNLRGMDYHCIREPTTMLLFGFGLIGLATLGQKKIFKKS